MFKNFKRKSFGENLLHVCVSAFFMLVALSYLYILVWAFIAGSRTNSEIVNNPFGLPKVWQWKNYIDVFRLLKVGENNFWDMLFNSVWFSVAGELLLQYTTATAAYACTRYKFKGSELPYTIILIMMTLPLYGTSGAQYKLHYDLGLINSYFSFLISATNGFHMGFLYYRAYLKNLSFTYAEAAKMDGANDFQIYFHVMLPLMKPLFGALFLTGWLRSWNDYSHALIYIPKLPTLPVGIYQFNTEMIYRARLDILFAACVIIAIPAIVIFTVFNKTITTNVSLGGIKG